MAPEPMITPARRRHPFQWHFSVDRYLNPWVPRPPFARLPAPVARFFGYRPPRPAHEVAARPALGNLVNIFWGFIGVFAGITIIEIVSREMPSFRARDAPLIVGSFGAAAVLEFYTIESPLAQPRNAVLGQIISSIVGIAISKLFALGPVSQYNIWSGGALACACATALMALTNTVHPPAGATALLAVVDSRIAALGWFLIPVMTLGCVLMQAVALIMNNIQRRFPLYWWTPEEVGTGWDRLRGRGRGGVEGKGGVEGSMTEKEEEEEGDENTVKIRVPMPGDGDGEGEGTSRHKDKAGGEEGNVEAAADSGSTSDEPRIVICRGMVTITRGPELRPEELAFLEGLSKRM